MLQSQTLNRQAFELFNSATIKVANYYNSLDSDILDQALADLNRSIQLDSNYFQPLNYKGIIFDMKGLSMEAIKEFNTIYSENLSERLRLEVSYNRAIANYHLYLEPNILAAITELSKLAEADTDNIKLKVLAIASLAQSYGMMVLHSQKSGEAKTNEFFESANLNAKKAISLVNLQKKKLGKEFIDNSIWIAYNAMGISLMFRDDLKRDNIQSENVSFFSENLYQALNYFHEALDHSPNNWALKCNEGSIYMRLGHLSVMLDNANEAINYFSKAKVALEDVINRLRPNYDFAYYELGRIYRFEGNKEKALEYFSKAEIAGGQNRNVSKSTIERNIQKAKDSDISFIIS